MVEAIPCGPSFISRMCAPPCSWPSRGNQEVHGTSPPRSAAHQGAGGADLRTCSANFSELVRTSDERLGKDQSYLLESSAMRQVHGWSIQPAARASGDTGLGGCQSDHPQDPALELPAQVMKLLVTGGCGYKGSVLIPLCWLMVMRDQHRHPVVWQCPAGALQLTNLRLDVRDTDVIPPDGVEAIIHLANIANDPAVELNPTLSWEVNVLAGQQLADRAVRAGVKHFLFGSSGSVYGVKDEPQVTEDQLGTDLGIQQNQDGGGEGVFLQQSMQVHCIRPATYAVCHPACG